MPTSPAAAIGRKGRSPYWGYWLAAMMAVYGLGFWISSLLPILPVPFTPFQTWRARLVIWLIWMIEITPLAVRGLSASRFNTTTEPKTRKRWLEAITLAVVFFAVQATFPRVFGVLLHWAGRGAQPSTWDIPVSMALDAVAWWLAGMLYFGWLYRSTRIGVLSGLVLAFWPLAVQFVMIPALNLLPGINAVGRQADALSNGLVEGLFRGALLGGSDLLAWRMNRSSQG